MNSANFRVPKRKDGIKTFENIIETAKSLFSNHGYLNTSVNEIIEKSGIATGTFYLYFDDKLALYKYILKQYRTSIRRTIKLAIMHCETRYDQEKYGIRAFLKFALNDPLSYRIIWESMFVDYTIFKDYYVTFAEDYMRQLATSQNNNEVRKNVDLETLSYILMGISNFVGLQVQFKEEISDYDLDRITESVMDILKNGMFERS